MNGDGFVDVLSGSYSRMETNMAGLFQVLYGSKEGFAKPTVLQGTDGEALIINSAEDSEDADTERICTRAFAVDWNGDGHLDLVSGNFDGSFWVFHGEGQGKFQPSATQLLAAGKPMRVSMHSDPFFVDWDKDGDQDLLSGSAAGGVTLFLNIGTTKKAEFGAGIVLLKAKQNDEGEWIGTAETLEASEKESKESSPREEPLIRFGDAHIRGPQGSTRVWADDLNGDGKLDLIVGDAFELEYPADGLTEETCRAKLSEWEAERVRIFQRDQALNAEGAEEATQEAIDALNEEMGEHFKARDAIVKSVSTGQIWVCYQK